MKKDIILAGVGGQGILSVAAIIGTAALDGGLSLKQSEVHGMSQRGGNVQSHLRISDRDIASDLIPEGMADMVISLEPMEALRYLPMLSEKGWVITNLQPFINNPDYPAKDVLYAEIDRITHHVALNADEIAKNIGAAKAANVVMLGAASRFLELSFESLEKAIHSIFGRKGENVVNDNLKALRAGKEFAEKELHW